MTEVRKITPEELVKILESHRRWRVGQEGGQRADLQGADLQGAYLQGADLQGAYLQRADLQGAYLQRADLQGAYLQGADLQGAYLQGAKIPWSSHTLLSEILWRAAGDSEPRQMLAAYVGRRTDWCWPQWEEWSHPEREWAIDTLAGWVQEGDDAPKVIRARAALLGAGNSEEAAQ